MPSNPWTRPILAAALAIGSVFAQQRAPIAPPPENGDGAQLRSTYVLGADDLIVIRALEADEINDKPVRIDMSGNIRLPLIGRVHAGGLTIEQLENELTDRLKNYVKQPQLSVSVNEFRSQPFSVIGSVGVPGVHQLQGRKTLIEVISIAGGLKEDAGPIIKITRQMKWGKVPAPGATEDPTGQTSTANINVRGLMEAKNPQDNILIRPDDVITVPRADIVYVIGEVNKPGGYTLRERESMSVLQALSMAGGATRSAGKTRAKILRPGQADKERIEIAVDVKKVMNGTANDVRLLPDDILVLPTNESRFAAVRAAEAALTLGTGLVLYRR